MANDPAELHAIAMRALEFVPKRGAIGLGTGHAASAFLQALAGRIASGWLVQGVPTSQAAAELARTLGIPLTTLDEHPRLAVDVDGADEVDPQGNLIKGYGGALVREKIVATASERLVILVGPEKLVPKLGTRGKLPVEVIPFGQATVARTIQALGLGPELRMDGAMPYVTDNGNHILDCRTDAIDDPDDLERKLRAIPGVVGTGLFLNMRPTVLAWNNNRVEVQTFE